MTNPSTTWSGVIFSQPLCNILCSTDSVTDHDNPAVKSIVILRIPKYNVLTYKKHGNQCNKRISLIHFLSWKTKIWLKCQFSHRTVNHRKICNAPIDALMCFIHHPSNAKNYSISHKLETDQPKPKINSPIKGWGGLSKNVQKMSKASIIELSQLGQDWFNFKWFNITHTSTLPSIQPPTHPPMGGVSLQIINLQRELNCPD